MSDQVQARGGWISEPQPVGSGEVTVYPSLRSLEGLLVVTWRGACGLEGQDLGCASGIVAPSRAAGCRDTGRGHWAAGLEGVGADRRPGGAQDAWAWPGGWVTQERDTGGAGAGGTGGKLEGDRGWG